MDIRITRRNRVITSLYREKKEKKKKITDKNSK